MSAIGGPFQCSQCGTSQTSIVNGLCLKCYEARKCYEAIERKAIERDGLSLPKPGNDPVHHPAHYNQVPGIECIDVIQHFNLNRGTSMKYIWRAGAKDPAKEIEDLEKAIEYLNFEIGRLKAKSARDSARAQYEQMRDSK